MGPSQRAARAMLASGVVLLVAWSSGCFGTTVRNEPIRYWVLDSLPGPPGTDGPRRVLGIGPVDLPAHLDRPGIVTREGENRLRVASLDQWGEPLKRGVKRVLSENLSVLQPGLKTLSFPWKGPVEPEIQLALSVTRLDARRDREVELLVSWVLRSTRDSKELVLETSWIKEPTTSDGVEGVVAALGRALERLSRELDPALRDAFARVGDRSPAPEAGGPGS
ncbi:MAG: PqiC family protein [Myxococcota bacterium]